MPRVLEKKERSLGTKLSIRGHRCNSPKCALIRKPYKPGQHGKKFGKPSEFGLQLQEKQKIRLSYGLTDRQLKSIFARAAEKSDAALKVISEELESRLDNVVMRMGFTESRSIGRHLVSHGHFLVNGKTVNTPSYRVRAGDTISIKPSSQDMIIFQDLAERLKNYEVPTWLSVDKIKFEGKVETSPRDVELPFDVNIVVDYYSKK